MQEDAVALVRRRRRARHRRRLGAAGHLASRHAFLSNYAVPQAGQSCARARIAGDFVKARLEARHAGDRDHGGIVSAKLDARVKDFHALARHRRWPAVRAECGSRRRRPRPPARRSPSAPAPAVSWPSAFRRWPPARRPRCPRASASIERRRCAAFSFTASDTAVFNPEKLNSRPGRSSMGRGNSKRQALPAVASFASSGPPGYGRPNNFADLSNASPAASSRVSPSTA